MTVPANTARLTYPGNGATDTFAYTFQAFLAADITVYVVTDSSGARALQTNPANYTLTGVGSATGGNVVFGTAPASGTTVLILLAPPLTQTTDLANQSSFRVESIEDRMDKTVQQIQALSAGLSYVDVSVTWSISAGSTQTTTGIVFADAVVGDFFVVSRRLAASAASTIVMEAICYSNGLVSVTGSNNTSSSQSFTGTVRVMRIGA